MSDGMDISNQKTVNEDTADNDVEMTGQLTHYELVQRCKKELINFPLPITRSFHHVNKHFKDTVPSSSSQVFRLLSWNILSQVIGEKIDRFVACPLEVLDWKTRRWRILEEILFYRSDIICLQEVDHFEFFKKTLGTLDFSGVFFPKPDSLCYYIKDNNGPDGCAIFYDNTKFRLLKTVTRVLEVLNHKTNQVAIICILKRKLDNREICVVTTHLRARQGHALAEFRNKQGKDLLRFIQENYGKRPLVLAGDFNAEPTEPVYKTLLSCPAPKLKSSYTYLSDTREEPFFTTWKIREEGEVSRTLDYIFFTQRDFRVEQLLKLPLGEQIGANRIPSLRYPSDHFSLVCDFKFN